jgi:RpiB/LacA/LacB family sugar-phosphate isomerase
MKIFIGADHRGFDLKKRIQEILKKEGHELIDIGTHVEGEACDYPDISYKVATEVVKNKGSRGILICNTGIGHTIAANKVPGAYAALVYNQEAASLSRQHNDSNILVLGSLFITKTNDIPVIINTWLKTEFEGGRHERRTEQIKKIEKEFLKG